MEQITITPTAKKVNWSPRETKLTDKSYSLISHINFILEQIIINTLQYNKLTSADEIFERLITVRNETVPEVEIDIDLDTVENICQSLCMNNGVLISLIKNNMSYYKLNHKNYM